MTLKYCFITDEKTGLVQLGAGCSDEYYIAIGMKQRDVQQSDIDNQWYLSELCPMKTEEEKIAERKADFENSFLSTAYGNFRLRPKGYSNAQQSIDTVNNMVDKLGSLTEDLASRVIFYATPDFTKEEECTEEWLIEHQTTLEPMTKEEWASFYVTFTTLYSKKQYEASLAQ